jgi:predicted ATPase/DNA-binding CsgD family transcriptional regulator
MADSRPHSIPDLPEPLSPRERDILTLLAENLSNHEIADRLFLAYTTVKWYNRQIFGKLGVENREQAVQRAFALNLLKPSNSIPAVPAHLPVQLTPFIGREDELEALSRLFSQPHNRLLTILAPGGMGKTRLALAAAENALKQFEHGIFFIPLAPLTTTDQLVPAIAAAIGLHFSPDHRPPQRQLLEFLSTRNTLLVLDNFEHLLDGAALVTDLLNAAPKVKALVTSRERLNLTGETIYTLGGLPYPGQFQSENPLNFSAVKLFVQCASRANSHFVAHDAASIAHVCQLVQGMPLALELAAAWAGTLSPAEIAAEIIRSADFLHTTMRNAPERLRSIRAVFEATWRRLTLDERQAFRRLSIFRGGCTREAAQGVAGVDLSALAGLVDKALLRRSGEGKRYEIHELLRQYAAEQLDAVDDFARTRSAYRDYFGKLAQV